jgi:hypothetical protein
MHLLELILAIILIPFWFPVLLIIIGFFILLIALLLVSLLIFLFLSLCFVIGTLKILYNIHMGLVEARQTILKDIGDSMSWWGLGRLILNRHRKQVREARELKKQKAKEEEQADAW